MKVRCATSRQCASQCAEFLSDSAVLAYRTPEIEVSMASLHPKAASNTGPIDAGALLDDSLNTSVNIIAPKDGTPAWLQYEFEKPFTARALSLGCRSRIPVGRILAGDDGVNFRTISVTPGPQGYHGAAIRTFGIVTGTWCASTASLQVARSIRSFRLRRGTAAGELTGVHPPQGSHQLKRCCLTKLWSWIFSKVPCKK